MKQINGDVAQVLPSPNTHEDSNTGPQHHGEAPVRCWGAITSPWRAKSCVDERIFTCTGLIGCEGAQVLHRWARGSDSRSHGSSEVLGCAALSCEVSC
jgi:hypothetical protein